MISPETLSRLMTLSVEDISTILATSGYTGCFFESAEFCGLTKLGQFVYAITFFDEQGTGDLDAGKVYVSIDHNTEELSADF